MEMHNVDVTSEGNIRPRKGFKTFAGMVWQLWQINRRFNKLGVKGSFSVTLPLPEGGFESRYKTGLIKFPSPTKEATQEKAE